MKKGIINRINTSDLKFLISKGKESQAFSILISNSDIIEGDKYEEILLLSNQYNREDTREKLGISENNTTKNRIVLRNCLKTVHQKEYGIS